MVNWLIAHNGISTWLHLQAHYHGTGLLFNNTMKIQNQKKKFMENCKKRQKNEHMQQTVMQQLAVKSANR